MSSSKMLVGLALPCCLLLLSGCGGSEPEAKPAATVQDDHDHEGHDHDHDHADHDHAGEVDVDGLMPLSTTPAPESLDQGIKKLESMRNTIAQGFENDDVDSIHDQLHSIGGLLENLEGMIDKSEASDGVKQQAKEAITTLFDAFGDVDAKLHGDDGKDYADVSDKVNSAIQTLTNLELP